MNRPAALPFFRFAVTTLCLVLLCFSFVTPALAAEPSLCGDANGDGAVTAADAAILLRAVDSVGNASVPRQVDMDITGNGSLTGTDARAVQWLATGQIGDLTDFVKTIHTGLCGEEDFHYFSYTGLQSDGNGNYRSASVGVQIHRGEAFESAYYLADIHIRDLNSLRTRFGGNEYLGGSQLASHMARQCNAIVAVNGDYYSFRSCGPLVRNGTVYRPYFSFSGEIGFLLRDGSFTLMTPGAARVATLETLDPYQTWLFGPSLLTPEGEAKTSFSSELTKANPRTVFGYYAPGHYALLVVDGRQKDYSLGLELKNLSSLCQSLGMTAAYNLDGGQSTVMAAQNGLINRPASIIGRPVSDIVYVCEPDAAYS